MLFIILFTAFFILCVVLTYTLKSDGWSAMSVVSLLILCFTLFSLTMQRNSFSNKIERYEVTIETLEAARSNPDFSIERAGILKDIISHNIQVKSLNRKNNSLWHDWFIPDDELPLLKSIDISQ